ncbi:hypothetical protein FR943_11925 [Mycobacterium sp. TNTM28]|uniref:Uncharacterized protein n=1 Tax=[Mycobacterium] fortunisiensis TaxID=2600579 RepID=A0ABS6KLU5_9MYCO|nr:hypothetical protein [[Mycobacterium] fortunisiensis]MBU9764551.1 hypothetical protein [[Mycobacterium] fortunisiensis]
MSSQPGMSAQMSEVPAGGNPPVTLSGARPRVRPEQALHYELTVMATDVGAMVSDIGGWLFDRAMAGWRVNVVTDAGADGADTAERRALGILGVRRVASDALSSVDPAVATMTAISVDCFTAGEPAVRTFGDVFLYGRPRPDDLTGPVHRLQYRPSTAALAFKAHALAVLGEPRTAGGAETMFRYGRTGGLLDSGLVPVC